MQSDRAIPRFKGLEYIFSYAEVAQSHTQQQNLANLLGLKELPVAALRYFQKQKKSNTHDEWYMCADPVYIQPDRDSAVLLASENIALSHEEANKIIEEINAFYQEEPWELILLSEHHWVIRSRQNYVLKLSSLNEVYGQHIHDSLPAGKDARYWQQILNEIQM